jgi:hypothetical protein
MCKNLIIEEDIVCTSFAWEEKGYTQTFDRRRFLDKRTYY